MTPTTRDTSWLLAGALVALAAALIVASAVALLLGGAR